ncbi:MAG: hypothetical protein K0Q79_2816 [Flavipsychrobacter sp.]|nr:hypothetical protein [Flavipsychrobacter sp.]
MNAPEKEKETANRSSVYDEATLNSFRQTSKDYSAGKMKGYSVTESMKRVRKKINKNAGQKQ